MGKEIELPKGVSVAGLLMKVDCTPEGRKNCKGRCCCAPSIHALSSITDEEYERMPEAMRKKLNPKSERWGYTIQAKEDGYCSFIDLCCAGEIDHKPARCWMYPLVLNKHGTLVADVRYLNLHCPNSGKGPALYIALKDEIILVYGKKYYQHLCRLVKEYGEEN